MRQKEEIENRKEAARLAEEARSAVALLSEQPASRKRLGRTSPPLIFFVFVLDCFLF